MSAKRLGDIYRHNKIFIGSVGKVQHLSGLECKAFHHFTYGWIHVTPPIAVKIVEHFRANSSYALTTPKNVWFPRWHSNIPNSWYSTWRTALTSSSEYFCATQVYMSTSTLWFQWRTYKLYMLKRVFYIVQFQVSAATLYNVIGVHVLLYKFKCMKWALIPMQYMLKWVYCTVKHSATD